jgi:hypothetical protein
MMSRLFASGSDDEEEGEGNSTPAEVRIRFAWQSLSLSSTRPMIRSLFEAKSGVKRTHNVLQQDAGMEIGLYARLTTRAISSCPRLWEES